MNRFAALLEALLLTPSRNGKLRLMREYFAAEPDPERGWALAALTGELSFAEAKPGQVRALAAARVDPELFGWSYDFVGDLAETVSLIWPAPTPAEAQAPVPSLTEIVETLHRAGRAEVAGLLGAVARRARRHRALGAAEAGHRRPADRRLGAARQDRARRMGWRSAIDRIEEVWHGLSPPYRPLFAWLEGRQPPPDTGALPNFCPVMLAQPLEDDDLAGLDPADYLAEWKWDGIRVQLVARGGESGSIRARATTSAPPFPTSSRRLPDGVTLDGELLVMRDGEVAPFNDLQQRLNRKTAEPKMLARLSGGGPALRHVARRGRGFARRCPSPSAGGGSKPGTRDAPRPALDLSPLVPFASWDDLRALRDGARDRGIEGLMLKRADSLYLAGRPKGPWFKWKRGALTIDAVLMYAQRGHGKRSSFYSDYTFGAWAGDALVPVGKAYFGFTDEELRRLDSWVRDNTVERFGPVREVAPGLVLEIAFDSVHRSTRHKSGVAMRFPRIHRIRWDKPSREADTLETLERMLT